MTDEPEHPTPSLEQRVELLEALATAAERRFEMIAARLELMQIQQAKAEAPSAKDSGAAAWAPDMLAGRWHKRDGTVYPNYTYHGTHAAPGDRMLDRIDPQLRRSPPATE